MLLFLSGRRGRNANAVRIEEERAIECFSQHVAGAARFQFQPEEPVQNPGTAQREWQYSREDG